MTGAVPSEAAELYGQPHSAPTERVEWVRPVRMPHVAVLPVALADLVANVRANVVRPLPQVAGVKLHDQVMVFVGGGPSAVDCLPLLREYAGNPRYLIFTSGMTHRWLLEHGITPWCYIAYDPKAKMIDYLDPIIPGVRYLVASISPPPLVDRLIEAGVKLSMFHPLVDPDMKEDGPDGTPILGRDSNDIIAKFRPNAVRHPGGVTTMLGALPLAFILGFRRVELVGVDSCYAEGRQYAYDKTTDEKPEEFQTDDGREFVASRQMAVQALEFLETRDRLAGDLEIAVHGDGFLPHLHRIVPIGELARRAAEIDAVGRRIKPEAIDPNWADDLEENGDLANLAREATVND